MIWVRVPRHFCVFAFTLVLVLVVAGCAEHERATVFAHITDPHLYIPVNKDTNEAKKAKQESLNQDAMKDILERLRTLPDAAETPAFLVLTGDLGVDPCDIAKPEAAATPKPPATQPAEPAKKDARTAKECVTDAETTNKDIRAAQVKKVAEILGASPLKDIYLVAGNNDIAGEDPDDAALEYFNKFIAEVQTNLDAGTSRVQLHNLTGCYAASGGPSCSADVPNSNYRFVGFPSYSYKNKGKKDANDKAQADQFRTFRSLVDQAQAAHKRVLVLSHVPEIDDPYTMAQDLYDGSAPAAANDDSKTNPRSPWSTWNINSKLLNDWKEVLELETVAGVFAGHLHDSHKETYRPPYSWSTGVVQPMRFGKLYLAPPIAVKNQDISPIQARGLSLVTVKANGGIEAQLFWYTQKPAGLKADRPMERGHKEAGRGWLRPVMWAWELDGSDTSLIRCAVLGIALLTAFLTVVAVWQIPPAQNPLSPKATPPAGDKNGAGAGDNAGGAGTNQSSASPFANNFGKTVLAGLGGLVVTDLAKSLGATEPTASSKWFYIVWFVGFFFLFLFGLGFVRAVSEGFRALVVIRRYPLARPKTALKMKKDEQGKEAPDRGNQFYNWFTYWFLRLVHWVFSLRVPFLTSVDTFIYLIQGKNQTLTSVVADTIVDQQRTVVRVADVIRGDLTRLIERYIDPVAVRSPGSPVRINISVLSNDQTNVYYISRSVGSARQPFPKSSLAWVSVFTGKIRWYQAKFHSKAPAPPAPPPPARVPPAPPAPVPPAPPAPVPPAPVPPAPVPPPPAPPAPVPPAAAPKVDPTGQFDKIILYDNSHGDIAGEQAKIFLQSHYQDRDDDYKAFVMFPVPWPHRGIGTDYVKGAIHISFRDEKTFEDLWAPEDWTRSGDFFEYPTNSDNMLGTWCKKDDVRAALISSVDVLGELLRGFNETIYKSYIEPNQPD